MMFVASVTSMFNLIHSEALCPTTTFCYCDKTTHVADCGRSGAQQRLTSVPPLPSYIYHIWLDGNYFPNISKDKFDAISGNNIISISMRKVGLQYITSDAFEALYHLQSLDLGYNEYINVTSLKHSLFSLKTYNLQRLAVRHTRWEDTTFTDVLPQTLQELDISSNGLSAVPDFCSPNNTSNAPSLQILKLNENKIQYITCESFRCLPSIEIIFIGRNALFSMGPTPFYYLNRLHTLSGSYLAYFSPLVVPSLKNFIFNYNQYIPEIINCTRLEYLDLSYRQFPFDKVNIKELLGRLPNLKTLNMSYSNWKSIPNGFFKLFPNLEYVDFHGNAISELTSGQFSVQSRIKRMLLSDNRIYHIGYDTFQPKFWQNIKLLDLSSNPFNCDCNLLWFRDKFKASPEIFGMGSLYPKLEYKCSFPPERAGLDLRNFNLTYNECKPKSYIVTILASCGSVVVVVLILFVILYKGRWHIRYWIYLLRYRRPAYRRLDDVDMLYDAFVIYTDEDSEFVLNTLLPRLEDEEQFRLCIHFRDFQPGRLIADNIVESMGNSRMAILVLSKSFCESRWCKFELTIAQDRWLNNESETLLLIMLEDLEGDHMTRDIRALIKITTYVMWTDDHQGQRLFWDKVVNTLRRGN